MTTAEKTKPAVDKTIDVAVPVTVAYNQWTQFEQFPQFMKSVKQITQTDNTHLHWVVSIAGVKREFDAEILEQQPDERIAWQSTDGKVHSGVVTFHPIDAENTRINVEMDWKPDNIADMAGKILQLDDISVQQDLKNFKELIESQGFEDGAWRGEVDSPEAFETPAGVAVPEFRTAGMSTDNKYGDDNILTSQFMEPETHNRTQ